MGNPRGKADPAQLPVVDELRNYVAGFDSISAAAKRLGVSHGSIRDWIVGRYHIPEWVCEVLGYRKVYVRCDMGIAPTGKRP